jgi:hypothetical protein
MHRIARSVVLMAALVLASCGSAERANAPADATNHPRGTAATPSPSSSALPLRVERLDCADGGALPSTASALRPGWRRRSVVAGRLTFLYARDLARQPATAFRPERTILRDELRRAREPRVRHRIERTLRRMPRDGLGVAELLVLVEPGRGATAVVPASAQGRLRLVYSRRARDAERPGAAGIIRLADRATLRVVSRPWMARLTEMNAELNVQSLEATARGAALLAGSAAEVYASRADVPAVSAH